MKLSIDQLTDTEGSGSLCFKIKKGSKLAKNREHRKNAEEILSNFRDASKEASLLAIIAKKSCSIGLSNP